jgi:arylsulfatase A-like enzyme
MIWVIPISAVTAVRLIRLILTGLRQTEFGLHSFIIRGGDVSREALYFEHQADRAVRAGKWKLVSRGTNKKPYAGPWELYDLEKDRTELDDLSKRHPDIAKKLKEMWHQWAMENNVYPLDNRGWDAKVKASVE